MVNRETINERLQEMKENLVLLEELKSISFDKFRDEPKNFKSAERCLQISIQCILDICHHLIVDNNWTRPRDNKHALEIIAAQKIIPRNFAKRIEPMVGLRNILVHEYIKVDPQKIYRHLQELDDFRTFQKHIIKFLQKT